MWLALEGCIGAGKTTVATGLAEYRSSDLTLEAFETNPFLAAFYGNPDMYALETEFAFLLIHYHQLKRWHHLNSPLEMVADFHLGKDLIYARLNMLRGDALDLFTSLHGLCTQELPPPDMVIFLSAPTDLVVERVRRRNRSYEQKIDVAYYAALNEAYERFFIDYPRRKLLISMSEWDFVKEPDLYAALSNLIDIELASK